MLLRNVITGKKAWFTKCYLNGKVKMDKIIFWKGPEDDTIIKYKIMAWKWEGIDRKISIKEKAIFKFVDNTLLGLDIPDQWREELLKWKETHG